MSKIDHTNLNNLLFNEESNQSSLELFYAHPSLCISNDQSVIHGRGCRTSRDIRAGECLFVTPPTVGIEQLKLKFLKEYGDPHASTTLEKVAMDLLEENMMQAIRGNDHAIINSFMVLMGAEGISSFIEEDAKYFSIDLLNGKHDGRIWSDEELACVTKKHLRNIILKNGEKFFVRRQL